MSNDLMNIIRDLQERSYDILVTNPIDMKITLLNFFRHRVSEIYVLGGIDSRVVFFSMTTISESYVVSIGKKMAENMLINSNEVEEVNDYCGRVRHSEAFLFSLCNRKKVGLISLAKPQIYTFPRFPLGISYIANSLRNQNKSDVYLFDLLFDVLKDVIIQVKSVFPKLKIVIGGSLAAIDYVEILKLFPDVIVSLGEGEDTWPLLVDWLNCEYLLSDISNISFFDGRIFVSQRTPPKHNYSLPELDLLLPIFKNKGVFQIETSRGCYNSCSFCPRQLKGKWKPIVDENSLKFFLDAYTNYLISHKIIPHKHIVYIVDEEFIGKDSDENRDRIKKISELFFTYHLRFEVSFRMNNVYSSSSSNSENNEKIWFMKHLKECGINRVLVGVESGIQNVLLRFNKNVTSNENTIGIRTLTALGIPIRFTYITFDPLMSFDELIETYIYQGRKDLILDSNKVKNINDISKLIWDKNEINKCMLGKPLYHFISYMLVSLECLIGSKYYCSLENKGLLEDKTITALGKKNAIYSDIRVGVLSEFCQLWIDNLFSLDYTLKSLGKIYSNKDSLLIRSIRTIIKDHSYRLLGKMIYFFSKDRAIIIEQPDNERKFIMYLSNHNSVFDISFCKDYLYQILDFQHMMLESDLDVILPKISSILTFEDYNFYKKQYNKWKKNKSWSFIHNEYRE